MRDTVVFTRFGGDLLSHDLSRSTIGAVALNGRVRDGIGCFAHAVTTKPAKPACTRRGRPVGGARGLSGVRPFVVASIPGLWSMRLSDPFGDVSVVYWIRSSLSGD